MDSLLNDIVSEVVINDYDKGIYAFGKAILTETDRFINDINNVQLPVKYIRVAASTLYLCNPAKEIYL